LVTVIREPPLTPGSHPHRTLQQGSGEIRLDAYDGSVDR
jgi:hypothetical protein